MKLKPVTPPNEVVMEALDRESSPRWPTNITYIIYKLYCNKLTITKGPTNFICCFSSALASDLSQYFFVDSPQNPTPFSYLGMRGDSRPCLKPSPSIWALVVLEISRKWSMGNIFSILAKCMLYWTTFCILAANSSSLYVVKTLELRS